MNAYKILGVDQSATDKEIKKKYRSLAQELHPDKNPGDKVAEKKFKEISEAYSMINDAEKRAEHDAILRGGFGPRSFGNHYNDPFGQHGQFDRDSIIDELFSRGGFGGFEQFFRGQSRTRYQSNVDLSLQEVATGTRKSIVIPGSAPMEIAIPPGLETGEVLEVPINRMTSMNLHVRVRPHPIFKRSGVNLHAKIDIPIHIAMSGGDVDVPTLNGHSKLKIPAGTSSHSKLRIAGAGIRRGAEIGAIYNAARLTLSKMTKSQRDQVAAIMKG